MEWHHFQYFQVLAETEHMTKAAEKLAISQPALSRAIGKLEEELGCHLFDRRGKSIRLNKYGEAFLNRTNKITLEMKIAKDELQEMMGIERGSITFGFLHTLGATYIPNYIRYFKEQFQHVQVKLIQNNTTVLLKLLKEGLIDICLVSSKSNDPSIELRMILQEELYITIPTSHPLSNKKNIHLSEVANEAFIVLKQGFPLRNTVDNLFQKANIDPTVSFEGEEIQTIASLVGVNLGLSILPKLKNAKELGINQLKIANKDVINYREIYVATSTKAFETKLMKEMKSSIIEFSQFE